MGAVGLAVAAQAVPSESQEQQILAAAVARAIPEDQAAQASLLSAISSKGDRHGALC
jgi:hypothetical protein